MEFFSLDIPPPQLKITKSDKLQQRVINLLLKLTKLSEKIIQKGLFDSFVNEPYMIPEHAGNIRFQKNAPCSIKQS